MTFALTFPEIDPVAISLGPIAIRWYSLAYIVDWQAYHAPRTLHRLLSAEEVAEIERIGDNEACMALKGASTRHEGIEPEADHWPMRPELVAFADRWGINPAW